MAEDNYLLDQSPDFVPARRKPSGNKELGFPGHPSPDELDDDDSLDLATIGQVLWSRRYWILAAGAVGLALALIISFLQTPLYRSTVVLELNPPTIPILAGTDKNGGDLAVPNTDSEFLATQYGLLKSRALAQRVVEDLNLTAARDGEAQEPSAAQARLQTATDRLAEKLDVKPVRSSRLVELSYTAQDPAQASRIVNGFASAFLTASLERHFEATASARKFLKKRIEMVRNELNDSERKLVAYAKANNIINTSSEDEGGSDADTLSGASLVAMNEALARAQQKRISTEQRYRQAGSITEVNQSAAALRQEKARLEAEYREKSATFQDSYPEMVSLRSRIAAVENSIKKETGGASGALRAEYQAALAEEKSLKAKVSQLSGNVLNQRERSIQYNILRRELDTNRTLYDALLDRFNQVSVSEGGSTPQAMIVDKGAVPFAPSSPNIPRNLVLGLFLGLGLGTAFAFLYELITDTIKSPEDVREKLRLPLLGVIPNKKRKEVLAEQILDRKSPLSEAYASLLTTLQFTTNEGMPRSLLISSTHPGEGKSTTSFVLASALAQLGQKVLLLDADLRRPSFVVEERADIGFSRLLVTKDPVRGHLLSTHVDNLWLMPSGPVPPNPTQILNSDRTKAIMTELRQHFDVVIVDAPPIHGFADAPLLASMCGAVLFVLESGKTRRRAALEAIVKLQATGCLILGAALTKYRSAINGYGYGYGYYDYAGSIDSKGESHELMPQLLGVYQD